MPPNTSGKPRSVRSGKGLGDSLYLQSVVRHLVETGVPYQIEVCTSWPDVFRPIKDKITTVPFRRSPVDQSYHYISRKRVPGTDQFIDCCYAAGLSEPVDLRLDWVPRNQGLIGKLTKPGKPIVLVQLPRSPMGRSDGFGDDLLPNCSTIQRAIDLLGDKVLTVQIGSGIPRHRFTGLGLDLANRTSVSDLLDVAWASHGALGYCSFIAPLAESLRKPLLLVWSRRGMNSSNPFVSVITPGKIIHRPETTKTVMDDCSDEQLRMAIDALYQQIRCPVTV